PALLLLRRNRLRRAKVRKNLVRRSTVESRERCSSRSRLRLQLDARLPTVSAADAEERSSGDQDDRDGADRANAGIGPPEPGRRSDRDLCAGHTSDGLVLLAAHPLPGE